MITDKRRRWIKLLLSIIAACLTVGAPFVFGGCDGKGDFDYDHVFDDLENAMTTNGDDNTEKRYYDVIVRSDCSGEVYASVKELCSDIESATGAKAYLYYEYEAPEAEPRHSFIYVGKLDNSVCRRAYEDYRSDDFGYSLFEDTLIIGGGSDASTIRAIERFTSEVLPSAKAELLLREEDSYHFVGDYSDKELIKLNGYALSEYSVVYLKGDSVAMNIAKTICDDLKTSLGYTLPLVSDDEIDKSRRSICIGRTLRADTLGFSCSEVESVIIPYETGISVISDSEFGMRLGVKRLYEIIRGENSDIVDISSPITLTYEIEAIEIANFDFFKEMLDVSEILSVCSDVRGTESDVIRMIGLSASSFDYVLRNLANEYCGVIVNERDGSVAYYLYRKDNLTLKQSSIVEGDSSLEILSFTVLDNKLSFSLSELTSSDSPAALGDRLADEGLCAYLIFGRFFGEDEERFIESAGNVERLHHDALDIDAYLDVSHTSLSGVAVKSATVSRLTEVDITIYSE